MAYRHPKDWTKSKARRYYRNKSSLRRTYKAILPELRQIANKFGYCLAVHGSMMRDFDIVAVPWRDDAGTAKDVVDAIKVRYNAISVDGPHTKPHGRTVWCIHLILNNKFSGYLDLGFLPRTCDALAWHTRSLIEGGELNRE